MEFNERFPDDAACLNWLVGYLYPDGIYCPKCERATKHHRVKERTCFACQFCGHQEYPMKGTIFEGSSTSLRLWFYGIYLMASTRGGISAKQLEREIGVSYPTAHRMFKQIRSLLAQDDDDTLSGTVEMDETWIGGQFRNSDRRKYPEGRSVVQSSKLAAESKKTPVFGMVQRGGKVMAQVVPSTQSATLMPYVQKRVLPTALVYTDEAKYYKKAVPNAGYQHKRIHHGARSLRRWGRSHSDH